MGIVYSLVRKGSEEEEGEPVGEHRGFPVISKTAGDIPVLFVCVGGSA